MNKQLLRKIELMVAFILAFFSDFISVFIPVKKNLILIGAMGGRYYGDNSRYIYENLITDSRGLEFYWVTRNKSVYQDLLGKGAPTLYAKSLKGLWFLYRANIALYTNGVGDLSFYGSVVPKRLKLIALRHGRSVKRVRFATKIQKFKPAERYVLDRETKMINYAISTSDFISELQKEVLNIELKKQIVTGYPRNDVLFERAKDDIAKWQNFIKGKNYNKIILYGPTWRHGRTPTKFFPFDDLDLSNLNQILINANSLLLVRPHKNELNNSGTKKILMSLSAYSNIKLATHNDYPSVNDIIPFCDVLICDYSALYHDYLLLDRPLIFIPYDYSEFEKENGFLYDYYKYLPGPAVLTYREFKNELMNNLNGFDEYKNKRKELTNLIHKYKDNKSTERVIDLTVKLSKEI